MHSNQYTRELGHCNNKVLYSISNRFIPLGQGGIEMNDNIVYQRSAGISTALPAGVDTK